MKIKEFLLELEKINIHTQKRFDIGRKNCVTKNYIEAEDLTNLINQFKESSSSQLDNVCSSIV